jgi:hypothetical protein
LVPVSGLVAVPVWVPWPAWAVVPWSALAFWAFWSLAAAAETAPGSAVAWGAFGRVA